MNKIFIYTLINQEITIYPEYADWYSFYLNFIFPRLNYDQICDEYQRARFINTAVIRNGKNWEFIHNLIIYGTINELACQAMILTTDILHVSEIKEDRVCNFTGTLLFETLDIIARHTKSLAFEDIYQQLSLLINKNYWKTIYPKRKFNKTNFCQLISMPLRTFQHQSKPNA